MPLINVSRNLVVQPSQALAGWIAQALAPLVKSYIQQEIQTMSSTVQEAVANLEAVAQRVEAQSAAKDQTIASQKAEIDDLNAKLTAAQAGDPTAVAAIDNVTAGLNQIAPAPQPPTDPSQQPQG